MKFLFEGQEYRIVFRYDWRASDDLPLTPGEKPRRQETSCELYRMPYQKGDEPFAVGTVHRYYRDRNSKEAARKAALSKALNMVPYVQYQNVTFTGAISLFKKRAWQSYLGRKQKAQAV